MSLADLDPREGAAHSAAAPTLFDLTARQWKAEAGVTAIAVDGRALAVAFALENGTIALARAADPEPSEARVRVAGDSGQRLLLPRAAAFAPVATIALGEGTPRPLAATDTGFLTSDTVGSLVRLSPRGEMQPLAAGLDGPIAAIATDRRRGRIAVAAGQEVVVLTENGQPTSRMAIGAARVLGFSHDGARLAVGGADGLMIVDLETGRSTLADCAPAQTLAWSPDGDFVAVGHATPGLTLADALDGTCHVLPDYPRPVRSIAFGGQCQALATSGAFRAVAWSMAALPIGGDNRGAFLAGRAGPAPVEAVALHPRRPIVAAGRADGSVALAEVGSYGEMALCGPSGEAVTALTFFGERDDLAIGFAGGSLAIASFPAIMFKC